ncbi:CAAX protease [Nocardia sp. NPDC057353]|uniref:CAAX protease n=1 Tax=Nocardia sp. NPDC057353 TaxID=3346104 RepID=UPI0036428782
MGPEDLRLDAVLSSARHAKYLAAANADAGRAARLFAWNCRLSAAYWPSIALVEMAVRNTINTRLCASLGVAPATGWHVDALGDRPRLHLLDKDLDKVRSAIDAFARRRGRRPTVPTGDDVVGGTSLGLWVALCGEGIPRHSTLDYHRSLWRGRKLWLAFPNYAKWLSERGERKVDPADNPGPLRGALRDFEFLRNRIAHHEPIYSLSHAYHRDNIGELAGLIDPALRAYIASSEQVTSVCADYQESVLAGDRTR